MKTIGKVLVCLTMVAFIAGCATPAFNSYKASPKNLQHLYALQKSKVKINVPKFTSSPGVGNYVSYRVFTHITAPNNESFSTYLHKAMVQELMRAKLYSSKSKRTLYGNLDNIQVNSMMGEGGWIIKMSFHDNKNQKYTISSTYRCGANFFGAVAAAQALRAFEPAAQQFLSKVYKNKHFIALFK